MKHMKTAETGSLYSGEQTFDRPKKISSTLKTDTGVTSGVSLLLAIERLEKTAVRIFG